MQPFTPSALSPPSHWRTLSRQRTCSLSSVRSRSSAPCHCHQTSETFRQQRRNLQHVLHVKNIGAVGMCSKFAALELRALTVFCALSLSSDFRTFRQQRRGWVRSADQPSQTHHAKWKARGFLRHRRATSPWILLESALSVEAEASDWSGFRRPTKFAEDRQSLAIHR
jgi:hypothetical protein